MKWKKFMKDDIVYLTHILDAINRKDEYVGVNTYADFSENNLIQAGVIRELEIIGEATKKINVDLKNKYKDVPWKSVAGMRDKLIHDYFGVDIDAVWKTIKEDIPYLKTKISLIIEEI